MDKFKINKSHLLQDGDFAARLPLTFPVRFQIKDTSDPKKSKNKE